MISVKLKEQLITFVNKTLANIFADTIKAFLDFIIQVDFPIEGQSP